MLGFLDSFGITLCSRAGFTRKKEENMQSESIQCPKKMRTQKRGKLLSDMFSP